MPFDGLVVMMPGWGSVEDHDFSQSGASVCVTVSLCYLHELDRKVAG